MNMSTPYPLESIHYFSLSIRRIASVLSLNRYSAEYRRSVADHVDDVHTLEDIIYIRNTPYISSILKMVHNDYLSREDFPFLLKPPVNYDVEDLDPEHEVAHDVLTDFAPKRRRRLIVMVIGGSTYTELHHLRTVAKEMKQKLVIVTTSLITPQTFIKTLSEVEL